MQNLSYLSYIKGAMHLEQVSLLDLSKQFATPLYIYSRKNIEDNFLRYTKSLTCSHKIFYAVKANSNLAILNLLAKLGAGFDTVSVGEIQRAEIAQANNNNIIFSGVGKRRDEITYAIQNNIHCINVESISELKRINNIASSINTIANIALRINPDVNPNTHPLISTGQKKHKFGIEQEQCDYIFANKAQFKSIKISGLSFHIGSQVTSLEPFKRAMQKIKAYILALYPAHPELNHLNIGGGLGINYHQENVPSIEDYTNLVNTIFKDFPLTIYLEPGRSIVAEAGILITKIEYIKANFIILDAGMNDLIRPCLYNSWHNIMPLLEANISTPNLTAYDLAGPICESSDILATNRQLCVTEGDYLCITDAGAYCASMSSNYNSRPKAAEVLVDKDKFYLIRARETVRDLYQAEHMLPV